ncbi:MAG TPA: peptidylprolyl isomerase [Thermoanaerobaculia bacterium]
MTLLPLGLVLLLAGLTACKKSDTETPPAETETSTSAPAQPGQAATPAAPGAGTTAPPGVPPEILQEAAQQPLSPEKMPEVVAKVNGQEIHKKELLAGAQLVQIQEARQGRQINPSANFYRQVLNELIAISLLTQDAKAQGVKATELEVQQFISSRKQSFPNEEAYKQALAKSGMTEDALRAQAREQLAVQKYVRTKLVQNVNVSDQATREFYEKNKAQISQPERVHVRHILIGAKADAPAADKENARKKAEDLLQRIKGGEDFAKLAQENSDDPGSKPRGGDLPPFARGQMVPTFEAAAFALQKPNDLSPVVESPFGYHIIQFLERQQASTIPYEQVKERLQAMLKNQQSQQVVAARVRDLRTKGKVEVFI